MSNQQDETREIIEEHKAALAKLERLEELKRQWWELDAEILLRPTYTEAEQEKIEDEILEIVLGARSE